MPTGGCCPIPYLLQPNATVRCWLAGTEAGSASQMWPELRPFLEGEVEIAGQRVEGQRGNRTPETPRPAFKGNGARSGRISFLADFPVSIFLL